jgi:putative hydrolase of the HAD superfamily
MVKPEKDIYRRIIDEYRLQPEESIFVDDMEDNIKAARLLNFGTIQFKNPKDLRESLISYNVNL